jgi:deoxyribodipyrimidine photo-lyase
MKIIVWFTQDLRLNDHPALNAALKDGNEVYCTYVFDPDNSEGPQGAARWWLHHSLNKLAEELDSKGGHLILRSGNSSEQVLKLAAELKAQAVYMTRSYEPYLSNEQTKLYELMNKHGASAKRFAGFLLLEPDRIFNKQAKPFQVFTPFYRHTRELIEPRIKAAPKAQLTNLAARPAKVKSESLSQWSLLPSKPNWAHEFADYFTPGEAGARAALTRALADAVEDYAEQRDFPALPGTSCLSAHLHFGEISPRSVLQQAVNHCGDEKAAPFTRQLFWREFNYYLLHHYPHMRTSAFKAKFDTFPWRLNKPYLKAWQQGKTGYPIVDAVFSTCVSDKVCTKLNGKDSNERKRPVCSAIVLERKPVRVRSRESLDENSSVASKQRVYWVQRSALKRVTDKSRKKVGCFARH